MLSFSPLSSAPISDNPTSGGGAVGINASLTYTELADSVSSSVSVGISVTLTKTEAADTISSSVSVGSSGITATLTYTESPDTILASVTVSQPAAAAVVANRPRFLWDNAVSRATLTAGSAAITQDNLKTDSKTEFWRSVAATTSTNVSASWTTAESVSMIAFPFCNFSPTATITVQLYSDTAGTTLVYTSPATLACAASAVRVIGLTAAQSASAYSYGGGTCAVVYFPQRNDVKKVVINIVDTNNLQGYLEAARLVVGAYYTPTYDVNVEASFTMADTGKNFRSDAGNLLSDIGTRNKEMEITLGVMLEVDRAAIWKIVSYCGTSYPVFVSVSPENTNKDLELANTVYGKFSNITKIAAKSYGVYTAPIQIEGV